MLKQDSDDAIDRESTQILSVCDTQMHWRFTSATGFPTIAAGDSTGSVTR